MHPRPALLLLLSATLSMAQGSASAQTESREQRLYRCGPQGLDLRDQPCPAGQASSSQLLRYDQPSPQQTQAARQQAQQLARQGQTLQRQREQQEARDLRANAQATGIQGHTVVRAPEPAASRPGDKDGKKKGGKAKKPQPPKAKAAKPQGASPAASAPRG
jgi:hypothetical protein